MCIKYFCELINFLNFLFNCYQQCVGCRYMTSCSDDLHNFARVYSSVGPMILTVITVNIGWS